MDHLTGREVHTRHSLLFSSRFVLCLLGHDVRPLKIYVSLTLNYLCLSFSIQDFPIQKDGQHNAKYFSSQEDIWIHFLMHMTRRWFFRREGKRRIILFIKVLPFLNLECLCFTFHICEFFFYTLRSYSTCHNFHWAFPEFLTWKNWIFFSPHPLQIAGILVECIHKMLELGGNLELFSFNLQIKRWRNRKG